MFLPPFTYSMGDEIYAYAVAIADVNGDEKVDLLVSVSHIVGNQCGATAVAVLLGDGDGTFQPAVFYNSGGDPCAGQLTVGDLNGDGKPDVIVANNPLAVLLGNGDGTFQPAVTYDPGSGGGWAVAVADVNHDGRLDILAGNYNGNVGVLLGNGDGTLQPAVTYYSWGGTLSSIAVVDVNGDTNLDVVVTHVADSNVAVLLGNGDGTFQPGVNYFTGGEYTWGLAVGDVNADSKPDLVVADYSCIYPCFGEGAVGVLLGNGDGTFQPAVVNNSIENSSETIAVADLNGDGRPDLATAGGQTEVLLGNGDGTFQSAVTYGPGGQSIVAGDVKGRGTPDLLVAGRDSVTVAVLLNNTSPHNPTTTTLASSPNPTAYGQPVTFTATVSCSAGSPEGTVVFVDSSAYVGKAKLVQGSASLELASLLPGSHSMAAIYLGTVGFGGSASPVLTQVVNKGTTSTALASSANPAAVNQPVTYTAVVTSRYGVPLSGTVTFKEGTSVIATVPLAANQASYTTSYSTTGTHSIKGVYSGDQTSAGSTSPVLKEYIAILPVASKTVVASSGSPSFIGVPVTFTARVTSQYGTIPDGELVTFYDGTTTIGSVALASGTATYTTSSLSAKTHTIKATYAGDTIFKPSSGTVKQVVNKYPTTTTLTSSLNPSNYRQAVTFTATVTPTGPYPLTGKVRFFDGTLGIGSATLSGGVAKLTKSTLAVGTHPITAQYLSDAFNAKSTSSVVSQVVQ